MFERSAPVWPKLEYNESTVAVYSTMTRNDSLPPTPENSQKYKAGGPNRFFKILSRLRNDTEQVSVTHAATQEGLRISKLREEMLLAWQEPF